jgi:hypothetical protein
VPPPGAPQAGQPPAPVAAPVPVERPPRRGWPTSALVAVIIASLLAIGGVVAGQLQAGNQKDKVAKLEDDLANAEDDADAESEELTAQLTAAEQTATAAQATADQAAADLATAQAAAEAAAADAATKQTTIDDLTAQLAAQTAGTASVFPVGLEDFAKVDLSVSAMAVTTESIDCTYNDETCGFLSNPSLDMDVYLDNDQWNVTMRNSGEPYFQAKLVFDQTGSFSGSEYVNADGTCANGAAAKPFATIFLNPVEFTVVDGKLRAVRFRGYLEDSMECGDDDPHSTLVFEGRAG